MIRRLLKHHRIFLSLAVVFAVSNVTSEAALRRVARLQASAAPAVMGTLEANPVLAVGSPVPTACCRPVCVKYRDKAHRSVCCDPCLPNIQTAMIVCDPCTGCPMAIDVCLPGCCVDCPTVSERCTLFGRGAITYCWSCGFSATFRFQANGDVLVTYRS